jgi:hypothetical protein
MGIDKIVSAINKVTEYARMPMPYISAFILLCSVFKRPGMSAMLTASRIIKGQSDFGAPTGLLPDGSSNKMNALIFKIVDEIFREIRKNGVGFGVTAPGSVNISGTGMSSAGPITFTGVNTNPIESRVIYT